MYRSRARINKPLLLFILLATISMLAIPFIKKSIHVPTELLAVLRPQPVALTDFSLIDQANRPFTRQNLKGKNTMLFFGYMSCPDICPTTLTMLNSMIKQLGHSPDNARELQIVFVSVDPKRDTPEKIGEYLAFFNGSFIGVTGSKEEIDRLARQFGAGYMIEKGDSEDNYLVNHTSSIFLVDPNANLIASFSPPHDPGTISTQYLMIKDL